MTPPMRPTEASLVCRNGGPVISGPPVLERVRVRMHRKVRSVRRYLDGASPAGVAANVRYWDVPAATPPPTGYHSVTPRMVVSDVVAAVEFLRVVFDATGEVHVDRPAEIRIGDSMVLVSSTEGRELFPAFLYVYVDDADVAYGRSMAVGMPEALDSVRFATLEWGTLQSGQKIGEIAAVFPRIELKEATAKMRELEEQVTAEQNKLLGKTAAPAEPAAPATPKVAIDDFLKVDLRVGQVLSAERVKGSDKLMHMKVDIGEPEPRTIVAGIAEAYQPEQLLNRKVVIVANLQPRKLKGIESNGMIVAASVDGGKPVLTGFHEDIPVGARLK